MKFYLFILSVFFPLVLIGQADEAQADQLLEEAEKLLEAASYEEALSKSEEALRVYRNVLKENDPKFAVANNRVGVALLDNRRLEEAKFHFDQALAISLEANGELHPETAQAIHNIGNYFYDQGVLDVALLEYQKALNIRQQVLGSNHPEIANSYNNIGNCLLQLGQFESAVKQYKLAHRIRLQHKKDAPLDLASSFNNLGNIAYYQSDFSTALQYYQEALSLRKETLEVNHPSIADCYINIANINQVQGNLNLAINALNQATSIYKTLPGDLKSINLAAVYNSQGIIFTEKGDYKKAMDLHNQALNIRLNIKPIIPASLIESYNNLGNIYEKIGDFGKAILFFRKAESVYAAYQLPINSDYALLYDNIGDCQCQLGEIRAGILTLNEAEKLKEQLLNSKHPLLSNTLIARGKCYVSSTASNKRNPMAALTNFKEAEIIILQNYGEQHPLLGTIYTNIGKCYYELNDLDQAFSNFETAYNFANQNEMVEGPVRAQYCLNLGSLVRKNGDIAAANRYLELGFHALGYSPNEARSAGEIPIVLIGLVQEKGKLFLAQFQEKKSKSDLDSARHYYHLAIDFIDSLQFRLEEPESKQQLIDYNFQVFEGAISCAYEGWRIDGTEETLDEALSISERSKAILLVEFIRNVQAKASAQIPEVLSNLEDSLQIEIAYLEKQRFDLKRNPNNIQGQALVTLDAELFDLKQQYRNLIQTIESEYADYTQFKYRGQGIDIKSIKKKLLNEDQGIVEFFVGEEHVFAFLLTKQEEYFIQLPKDSALENKVADILTWVRGYLNSNGNANKISDAQYLEVAEDLYQQLLGAFPENALPQRLVIIPDDVLAFLPFELLVTQKSDQQAYRFKSHPYLAKEHAISYIYSITLLEALQNQYSTSSTRVLAFAPSFENSSFNLEDLVGNKEEAAFLEAKFGATTFQNGDATLDRFFQEAPNYSILHLATHGVARGGVGEASYLAFTEIRDSIDNEFLFVQDLYGMEIPANLVVLSACETGLGEFKRGQGIVGLAQGFFYAGAKSLIPTLWSIDDGNTAELMALFYENLQAGLPKDLAMQQAKIQFIEQKPNDEAHPYFWAAPVVIGNVQPLSSSNYSWMILGGISLLVLVIGYWFFVIRSRPKSRS